MRDRKGIILIAFDLPTETSENRSDYRKFRSYLIKNGYIMFQESIYYKIIKNTLNSSKEIREVSVNSPRDGNIIALPLTINELYKIRTIKGKGFDMEELTEDVFFY
ncbi:CRISPR-associated endonuclease Cas2 [Ruminococcus sp.]|uniref:CRISPR-associated endonuclease Cas2 n=1 Tax=Ruminococcus sp. TaxID=41978 RepID=UPI0025EB2343|nr:CRISPR-associated endonuclease Cas2 [Ruminococcus sp.]MBQ6252074.1 CRISPR-associated endonuclease Cas2 [Ruminococcus sp.]